MLVKWATGLPILLHGLMFVVLVHQQVDYLLKFKDLYFTLSSANDSHMYLFGAWVITTTYNVIIVEQEFFSD